MSKMKAKTPKSVAGRWGKHWAEVSETQTGSSRVSAESQGEEPKNKPSQGHRDGNKLIKEINV